MIIFYILAYQELPAPSTIVARSNRVSAIIQKNKDVNRKPSLHTFLMSHNDLTRCEERVGGRSSPVRK
jgi:hypothetical protein